MGLPFTTQNSIREFCKAFDYNSTDDLISEVITNYSLNDEQYRNLEKILHQFPTPHPSTREYTNRVRRTVLEVSTAISSHWYKS